MSGEILPDLMREVDRDIFLPRNTQNTRKGKFKFLIGDCFGKSVPRNDKLDAARCCRKGIRDGSNHRQHTISNNN